MIIGRGSIAQAITDLEGFTFYANGFSNRKPLDKHELQREMVDLLTLERSSMIVYFSSLAIYYENTDYTKHKLKCEHIVKGFPNYCIMRLGSITWGDNPNTLINHLRKDQSNIKHEFRYLIDRYEFDHWLKLIPKSGKHEMNVTGERVSIQEIALRINNKLL